MVEIIDITSQTLVVNLPCIYQYDWQYFLNFQSKRLLNNIEFINGNTYYRTIEFKKIKGFFDITPSKKGFILNISESFTSVLPSLLKKLKIIFDIETNINIIENKLKILYPQLKIQKGLHIPGVFSPYEAGIRAICSQQVSISAATKLINQFVALVSKKSIDDLSYFPSCEDITESDIEEMKTMQSKKHTLYLFSQWCCKNDIISNIDNLIKLKGIGKWTIDYIKLSSLNDKDIWMGTDLGIKKVLEKYSVYDIEKASPFKSYLTIHTWNHL